MRAEAQIKELVRKDGFLYTKDVVTVGIRKEKLKELLEEGLLMQEARGIYSFSDQMTDEFTLIQVRCRKGIYSHETALFFHGLTDQPRLQIAVTIPAGYCVNRIKEDFQHITFYRIKGSLWQVRIMERISPQGGAIYLYDKERDSKRLMEYISCGDWTTPFDIMTDRSIAHSKSCENQHYREESRLYQC